MSLQLDDARRTAQELAANGCGAHTILNHLYSSFDGMRFYAHTDQRRISKIYAEGDDVYFPPVVLCIVSGGR